ncbi:hypothetical protein [Paraflavitalea speifideaquila]|uniref:hypothetical protein n=1 Tax=Paraflavitalea speifideaquila TaxID=3076558 RepID=UPI0028E40E75|nr:hypothetical protein [Paraflavitalea speifideiaquila]
MSNPLTVSGPPAISLIASGLVDRFSLEPLVAITPNETDPNSNLLLIHFYIPDGPTPKLNSDFNTIEHVPTDAGVLDLRVISIDYVRPPRMSTTFSLWKIRVEYTVEGPSAEALWVKLIHPVSDFPVTARGTVTSVAITNNV